MASQAKDHPLGSVIPIRPKEKIWVRDTTDRFLTLHKPTGMWYVRAFKKGKKPLFEKTGYTLKRKGKAKTKALILLAEWMGTRPPSDQVILFRDFLPGYIEFTQNHTKLRPRTKEQALFYLTKLGEELGHAALVDINEGYVDEWLEEYRGRSKRTTFMDFTKYLGKALRHAHRKGLIQRLPEFKNPDPKKATGRCYSRAEIGRLIDHAGLRLELQIRMSLQCFMRLREMLFLTWDRVDLKAQTITLGADDVKTGSKTGVGRSFHFNDDITSLLRTQHHKHVGSRYVFPSPKSDESPTWSNKTSWKKAKRKAGIKGRARWHDLRHTALVWALVGDESQPLEKRKVANPILVSEYAGVSMKTIQTVYLKGKVTPTHTREVSLTIQL